MTIRAVEDNQLEASATPDLTEVSGRKVAFDYLRAFAVVLVLCHHAIIAYTISASVNLDNPIATASPVVNEQRWPIFDLIVVYNETFFMPLLFFISGLFVWRSLTKKGARKYLGGRLTRLGLPFAIGVGFLMPLAYYPAQLQIGRLTGVDAGYGAFWLEMVRSGFGTAGPLWFLSLLLAFDCLVTLLVRVTPSPESLVKNPSPIVLDRPLSFFGVLLGISIAVYPPMAITIGPQVWIGFGPFHAQAGRILLYLVYFLAGTAIGAYGIDRSVFRSGGVLTKRWWGWLALDLLSYIVLILMIVVITPNDRNLVSEIAFVVSCGATVLGMTGLFLRFAKRRFGILDSLSENSYGIYLVHYVFVTWLQYLLLESALAPGVKGMAVFLGTLILSWGTIAALRCIPLVAKII